MSVDKKYTQVFVLPDGSEVNALESYMGKCLQVPIQRIYQKPEHQEDNALMDEKWKNIDCKKIEVTRNYVSRGNPRVERPAVETMIIAENKYWIDYSTVKSYTGEKACNCEYYTKVEVVLADEEYSRRLFFDWKGNLSVYDFMQDLADRIFEEILENPNIHYAKINDEDIKHPLIELEFYTDDGESAFIEIESERGIEDRIASVRVIEFTEKITN